MCARGDCLPADEKSPVNQRFLPIWGKNGCVFQFPQNEYEEIALPRGIGFEEAERYSLAKGYYLAKQGVHGHRDVLLSVRTPVGDLNVAYL